LDVHLKGGEKVRGRLVSVGQNGFTLAVGRAKSPTPRAIGFTEIDKIVAHKPTHTPVAAWIATGAIVGVAVVAVVVFLIYRHNE
jgi:hypothetical protein